MLTTLIPCMAALRVRSLMPPTLISCSRSCPQREERDVGIWSELMGSRDCVLEHPLVVAAPDVVERLALNQRGNSLNSVNTWMR